jgi:hypothetical protein
MPHDPAPNNEPAHLDDLASQRAPGVIREFWDYLRNNKKWWLTPIIVILLIFSGLVILSGTAAAPFIYTLF